MSREDAGVTGEGKGAHCASPAGLPPVLAGTDMPWLGVRSVGKVRDSYTRAAERVLIATDRLSAFDRVLTTVPLKGQVLTQMARFWFERVAGMVPHHLVAIPDPCVMVVREVQIIPIEVVVRGYLAGSAWRDYQAGAAVSGVRLPDGLRQFDPLPHPIVTPSTKEAHGKHDTPIAEHEVVQRGIVSAAVWEQVRSYALALFDFAAREVAARDLIFVDTKYEFGVLEGRVVLADEIHTLDSSRFWVRSSYEAQRSRGQPPEMLDKEPVRRWLLERGFQGEGTPPLIDDGYRAELMRHYCSSFERITGVPFVADVREPGPRIEQALKSYFGVA